MNSKLRATMITFGLAGALAPLATAQCGMPIGRSILPTRAMLKPAALSLNAQIQDSFGRNREEEAEPIVGMWKVTFVARNSPGIPEGAEIDHGYSVWHSDNTEFLNSSRSPSTQNFCLGVWKQVGRATYKLNHFALAFDSTGNSVGTVNIREEVTVDYARNHFTGTFTIDAYDTTGKHYPADAPGNHANGVITGDRVTIYTQPD